MAEGFYCNCMYLNLKIVLVGLNALGSRQAQTIVESATVTGPCIFPRAREGERARACPSRKSAIVSTVLTECIRIPRLVPDPAGPDVSIALFYQYRRRRYIGVGGIRSQALAGRWGCRASLFLQCLCVQYVHIKYVCVCLRLIIGYTMLIRLACAAIVPPTPRVPCRASRQTYTARRWSTSWRITGA